MQPGASMHCGTSALLEVLHITRYRYAAPVALAHHLAHVRPIDDGRQCVEAFEMRVSPQPMHQGSSTDVFGNHRACFTLDRPHRELEVQVQSRVRVAPPPPLDAAAGAPWEVARERLRFIAGNACEAANQFVHASPYVPALAALRQWAAPAFTAGRPVAEVAFELMTRVHAEFTYRSASTDIDTPLADVLARREGVCQDFAHVLIGALRSHGLAARYVSGYLLTAPPDRGAGPPPGGARAGAAAAPWLGADASHAWVAVWCPAGPATAGSGAHWLELDPTNHVLPTTRHVRLAVGRDFGDVTPLRGLIRGGGGDHRLDVRVRTELV